ncbi:MAG: methyltransferase [Pseudomonadota bacterium]
MSETPPQFPLTPQTLLMAHGLTQVIISLHQTGILQQLEQQAQDAATLAKAAQLSVTAIQQCLPIAEKLGLVRQDDTRKYYLTDAAHCLLPDHPGTIIPALEHAALGYPAWGQLTHSLRTGTSAFPEAYGADIYDYLAIHPTDNTAFRQHMANSTQAWLNPAVGRYPFSGHVIDLGGNQGDFSVLLLQHYPELHSTVFDLPETVAPADQVLSTAGVAERGQIVAGSFFAPEQIPTHGSHYLFSRVLLNWSDAQVVQILQNCRQAMPADSKLVILEFVQTTQADLGADIGNLNLLVMFGARTRTQSDFADLVSQAGFHSLRWISASDTLPLYYLEAKPMTDHELPANT